MVVVLALLSVILGFCCTQSTLSLVDAYSAGRDAQAQVTIIQNLLKGGDYLRVWINKGGNYYLIHLPV